MNKHMNDKRQELLQILIKNSTQVFHDMNREQEFPFGNMILRRQQMMIMFFLSEKKGIAPVKEIAEFLQVTPGAVTQFVDGLVIKKLVEREGSKTDRRSINIKLTRTTKAKFDDFKKNYLTSVSRAFNGLSVKELEQFIKLVGKMKVPRC